MTKNVHKSTKKSFLHTCESILVTVEIAAVSLLFSTLDILGSRFTAAFEATAFFALFVGFGSCAILNSTLGDRSSLLDVSDEGVSVDIGACIDGIDTVTDASPVIVMVLVIC